MNSRFIGPGQHRLDHILVFSGDILTPGSRRGHQADTSLNDEHALDDRPVVVIPVDHASYFLAWVCGTGYHQHQLRSDTVEKWEKPATERHRSLDPLEERTGISGKSIDFDDGNGTVRIDRLTLQYRLAELRRTACLDVAESVRGECRFKLWRQSFHLLKIYAITVG